MTDKDTSSVRAVFERALGEILARVGISTAGTDEALAIAYSGGLDSSALLHLARDFAAQHRIRFVAFHIHHGISAHADQWLAHCERECERLGIGFDARRVNLARGGGLEQAARLARYAALGDLCRLHRVRLLLTAHHQDDQAETVLLHLLRGSGVAGLSAMEALNAAPDLLGEGVRVGRPLLTLTRAALAEHARAQSIGHIEDESNTDTRRARNALRHQVLPILSEYFPGFQKRFARSAEHARAAHGIMEEIAEQDLAACREGESIDLARLRRLGAERIDNLLRHWFGRQGIRMPSTAWLHEMRAQLLNAKHDAQLRVIHPDCEIHRHREHVFITPRRVPDQDELPQQIFRWDGAPCMEFPAFGGSLYFDSAEQGIDPDRLRSEELTIRLRSGGERLKLAPNRPTRSLKAHYQALGIPAWERTRLPLVCASGRLVYAAALGLDCHWLRNAPGPCVGLRWEADPAPLVRTPLRMV